MSRLTFAAPTIAALCSCSFLTDSFVINEFSGDEFPILVDTSNGAVMVGVQAPDRITHTAVLDVLSPITVIDRGPQMQPTVDHSPLLLLGERTRGGAFEVPRAVFIKPQMVSLHPCPDTTCTIGTLATPRPFDAILGADTFVGDALRLHLAPDPATADDQIYILPDIAGDEAHRTYNCDAVFPNPFRGGGTLLVGGTELPFINWRLALEVCLAPDPDLSKSQRNRGTDALFVASTAIGISLLDRSAYDRYQLAHPDAAAYADLTETATVLLPSGPISGRKTTLPKLALVALAGSNPRAPCREVYAHHLLLAQDCTSGVDCPCGDGDTFCSAPAMVELTPNAGLDILIIDDADPTLQALRTELRPDQPEVDGILGTNALRLLELDADYPNRRALGRCIDPQQCSARPEFGNPSNRAHVAACIGS